MQLTVGDYVVHSGYGVCSVVEKKLNQQLNKYFFLLKTTSTNLSIMIPEEKIDLFLRPVTDKKTCLSVFEQSKTKCIEYSKDNKIRKTQFQSLVDANTFQDSLYLLKCLYALMEEKKKEKKTLGSFDTQFLQQAQRKVLDEMVLVLDLSKVQAEELLKSQF